MADFSDVAQETYDFWNLAAQALKAVVTEINKGTSITSNKVKTELAKMRLPDFTHFACAFCTKAIAEYNAMHETAHTHTFKDVCYEAGCPAIPVCQEDPKKWEGFQCLSCVWYFLEGKVFKDEGNRYPLCQKNCKGFSACEASVPTDTTNFSPLSEVNKQAKLKFCLKWFWNEIINKDGWGQTVFQYLVR